jgi:hypothetical protein
MHVPAPRNVCTSPCLTPLSDWSGGGRRSYQELPRLLWLCILPILGSRHSWNLACWNLRVEDPGGLGNGVVGAYISWMNDLGGCATIDDSEN